MQLSQDEEEEELIENRKTLDEPEHMTATEREDAKTDNDVLLKSIEEESSKMTEDQIKKLAEFANNIAELRQK